jgi:hypothetical protein
VFIQAVVLRVKKKIAMVARGVRKPHEQCDQSTQASSPLSTISRVWEGEACWEVWHAVGQSADAEWEALDGRLVFVTIGLWSTVTALLAAASTPSIVAITS